MAPGSKSTFQQYNVYAPDEKQIMERETPSVREMINGKRYAEF